MKSKIKLISILVIAFITVSCTTLKNITETNVKKSNIEGVWKLIYSDLLTTNLPQEMTQYKIIVDGRFFWYKIDEEGIIDMSDGAGGTYYVRDNSYTEYVEHVFPEMRSFKNTKFRTDFEVSENMLKIKGTQPNSGTCCL